LYYSDTKHDNMKEQKDKLISLRLPNKLYKEYVDKAIRDSQIKNRIVTVSEIIREKLSN